MTVTAALQSLPTRPYRGELDLRDWVIVKWTTGRGRGEHALVHKSALLAEALSDQQLGGTLQ